MPLDNDPQPIQEILSGSGENNFVFAFVLACGSQCKPCWDGKHDVVQDTAVAAKVAAVRAAGGDISISFGGYNGVELGSVCRDGQSLANAYAQVIDKYDLTHIDLDIEGDDLGDVNGERKRFEVSFKMQLNIVY